MELGEDYLASENNGSCCTAGLFSSSRTNRGSRFSARSAAFSRSTHSHASGKLNTVCYFRQAQAPGAGRALLQWRWCSSGRGLHRPWITVVSEQGAVVQSTCGCWVNFTRVKWCCVCLVGVAWMVASRWCGEATSMKRWGWWGPSRAPVAFADFLCVAAGAAVNV